MTYTPAAGYTGADSFTYRATNAGGTSAPATVTTASASVGYGSSTDYLEPVRWGRNQCCRRPRRRDIPVPTALPIARPTLAAPRRRRR
ncbi:Ig-like domain-containing protein [Jeongeupia sp. HS-3]|uniref:Ig-like domain-containing protein n=1 Tax=Jeongeupia sp. HS-3 TaxID=1009682 RepID=UPI0035B67DBB